MKELYEVGDFVGVYIDGQHIYGTIIELSRDAAKLNTKEYPSLTVKLRTLCHFKQFPVGCIVKHTVTKRLYIIIGIFSNGTYSTNIDVEVPHKNLKYAAGLDDTVEFEGINGANILGKVVKVCENTGYITVIYTDDINNTTCRAIIHPERITNRISNLTTGGYSLKVNDDNNLFKVKKQ